MKTKFFAVALLFFTPSCAIFKDFRNDYKEPQVRIVDMQGNPHDVQLHTPERNADALLQQGNLTYEKLQSQPPLQSNEVKIAQNQYATQNALQNTLAMPIDDSENQALKSAKTSVLEDKETIKEIEYDLGKDEKPQNDGQRKVLTKAKKSSTKIAVATNETVTILKKGYYVQAGSFTNIASAESHLNKVAAITTKTANLLIQDAFVKGKNYHRVLIGPYKSRKSANLMISKLKRNGQNSILIKSR